MMNPRVEKIPHPRPQTQRDWPVPDRSIVRNERHERSSCLLRESGIDRQNRHAMRRRVCRWVVSATSHVKLADGGEPWSGKLVAQ